MLSIMLAEHFYFAVQMAVRYVMSKVESPGLQKERRERFRMKKQLMEESLAQDASGASLGPSTTSDEKITRETLEEDARNLSTQGHGTSEEL